MRQQRTRVVVNVGNLMQTAFAGVLIYGTDRLLGLAWALILAGVLGMLAAEFIYDAHQWRVPLPHRPQPRQRIKERSQQIGVWKMRRVNRWKRWRADRQDRAWSGRANP